MIYCVLQSEEFGEGSFLTAVFKDKLKAEKYCEIQNKLESYYNYYIKEEEFYDDKVSLDTEVAKYYTYCIDTDEDFCIKNCDDYNETWKEEETRLKEKDNFVIIYDTCLEGYSIESYERAREIALNEYNKLNNNIYPNLKSNVEYSIKDTREYYLPYDATVCPICGGKIKHPYTGQVTDEQLQEDIDTCQLIEVIDESNSTIGYKALCKKEWNQS